MPFPTGAPSGENRGFVQKSRKLNGIIASFNACSQCAACSPRLDIKFVLVLVQCKNDFERDTNGRWNCTSWFSPKCPRRCLSATMCPAFPPQISPIYFPAVRLKI
jgi:hypothetical protein